MKNKKHYSIPVFIPELACPHQCVFCNQRKISGQLKSPTIDEIHITVDKYLSTIDVETSEVEIAFFGGNFTGIPLEEQEKYLHAVQPYFEKGIQSLRLSTRPDYINSEILSLLKKYRVQTIEIGAQSMCDDVLEKSGRGHTALDIVNAAGLILKYEFSLGLQMMVGLPGNTLEKSLYTANKIVELGATSTRIYPAIVIKDTALEELFREKKYSPLSMNEAVSITKSIYKIFEENNVHILRVGLHPSEGLLNKTDLVAGPFHQSFRELVLSELWADQFSRLEIEREKNILIYVPAGEINFAVGYNSINKYNLLTKFKSVRFKECEKLQNRDYKIDYC